VVTTGCGPTPVEYAECKIPRVCAGFCIVVHHEKTQTRHNRIGSPEPTLDKRLPLTGGATPHAALPAITPMGDQSRAGGVAKHEQNTGSSLRRD
jgi:hypothetical protein